MIFNYILGQESAAVFPNSVNLTEAEFYHVQLENKSKKTLKF